jgi:PKD repeat protein
MRGRVGIGVAVVALVAGLTVPAHAGDTATFTFACCAYFPDSAVITPGGTVTIAPQAGVKFSDHPLVFVDDASFNKAAADATPVTRTFPTVGRYKFYCSLHGSYDPATGRLDGMAGTIAVTNNAPPVAKFIARPSGDKISFDASGSTAGSTITAYRWDFDGDGRVDKTTKTPKITQKVDQTGNATLTVVDNNAASQPQVGDLSSSTTQKVTVLAANVSTSSVKLAALRRGRAKIVFTVNETGTATATVKAGATTVATGRARIAKRGTASVTLKLTAAGKRRVAKARRLSMTATMTIRDGRGAVLTFPASVSAT